MVNGVSKKIVVIKNVPSNIIEEAILILKGDSEKLTSSGLKLDMSKKRNKWRHEYLLKEAEDIIRNYIKENKLEDKDSTGTQKKVTFNVKRNYITDILINTGLIASILLLFYIITRLV